MKILVFKVSQLGDNLVFLPVVQELCRRFGPESVHLITTFAAGELYEGLLPEDRLRRIERQEFNGAWKSLRRMAALLREVREVRADLAVLPFDQGNVARLLARWCGATDRVGADNARVKLNFLANHRLAPDPALPMARINWEVMRRVAAVADDASGAAAVPVDPPPPDLGHLLTSADVPRERRVMVHAGASRPYKRWPVDRFATLANQLAAEGFEVLWCGQGSRTRQQELDKRVEVQESGSLRDFIRSVASCDLFVGNNSGPMNIANALVIPSVIFSGPSPPKWDPFWHRDKVVNLRLPELACQPCDSVTGPVNECRNRDEPMACMRRWDIDKVLEITLDHWRRCRARRAPCTDNA